MTVPDELRHDLWAAFCGGEEEADPVGLAEYQGEARGWAELDVEVKDE